MSVFCLGSDQIDDLWFEFAQHLQRLQRLGHLNAEETREDLKLAKKQLWGYQEEGRVIGIAITRVSLPFCEVFAAAGKQSRPGQIQELYEHIERWARTVGCARMRINGRKGWMRVLQGYSVTGYIMEKEL